MTFSQDDRDFLQEWIVKPLSGQIQAIHTSEKCPAIIEVKETIKDLSKKVNDVKGQQKYFFGIFSALVFGITFFKDSILSLFRR